MLSGTSVLLTDVHRVARTRTVVNCGLARVRFPAPVRASAKIRASLSDASAVAVPEGFRTTLAVTAQPHGSSSPARAAERVSRLQL